MAIPEIKYCPGMLSPGFNTYSKACLNKVFNGKKVNHILPYNSPYTDEATDQLFEENIKRISISGVQEKLAVILEKNKLRLINDGERGTHILKPIPGTGKRRAQMPANEHLTMQIAKQVYDIETAANALIFFKNGAAAYITKRFDVDEAGDKIAQDDFASLAGKTGPTHGEHYKYQGNYLELFELMKIHLPGYKVEAPKLFKILMFNYLFSNGDAHLKNFSISETPMGDYRLSPAYDLLNSRVHIDDKDFALDDGLLPRSISLGKIPHQFSTLGQHAGLSLKQIKDISLLLLSGTDQVERLIASSFLDERTKRNYWQAYQTRLRKLGNASP